MVGQARHRGSLGSRDWRRSSGHRLARGSELNGAQTRFARRTRATSRGRLDNPVASSVSFASIARREQLLLAIFDSTMSETTRFLIVGIQRSGTTVTHHCLAGHPQVSMAADEVSVEPFFTRGLAVFTTGRESFEERRRGYLGLFDAISLAGTARPVRAAGIKVALGSPEEAIDLVECVREHFHDLRIVVVRRTDLIAQCGSLYLAMRTGQWHAFGGKPRSSDEKLEIPPGEFDAYTRSTRRIEAQLDRLEETNPVCALDYERDIERGLDHGRLFDFIGVDRMPVTWMKMQKVSPPAQSFIANHAELVARQPAITRVSVEEAMAQALTRQASSAMKEHPFLLVYRAEDRLRRSRTREAVCDVRALLARSSELEPWMSGRTDALVRVLVAGGHMDSQDGGKTLEMLHTDSSAFYEHRADVELRFGLPALARVDLLRSTLELQSAPQSHAWVGAMLEQVLEAAGDMVLASTTVENLLKRYPTSPAFLFLRAMLAHRTNDLDTARRYVVRALEIDPGHERAKRLRAAVG